MLNKSPSLVAVFAVYAVVLGCLLMAAPESARALTVPARFIARNTLGNCLTPQQDSELKKAIAGIQVTLNAAIVALDIAAAAESDPTTKKDLKEAVLVIKDVSVYLVANLTKIAESACGNCSQIIAVINETVAVIEETIGNIDPNWRNETVWKVVVDLITDILEIAEVICPNRAAAADVLVARLATARDRVGDSCLNASQLALLEKITAGIQIVLTTAEVALEIAERAETDPTIKKDLQEAITIIDAISQDLIANLTNIAKSPCATCTEIVDIVSEAISDLEATLTKINPNWENDPLWKSIVAAIQQILGYVKVLCPDSAPAIAPKGAYTNVY